MAELVAKIYSCVRAFFATLCCLSYEKATPKTRGVSSEPTPYERRPEEVGPRELPTSECPAQERVTEEPMQGLETEPASGVQEEGEFFLRDDLEPSGMEDLAASFGTSDEEFWPSVQHELEGVAPVELPILPAFEERTAFEERIWKACEERPPDPNRLFSKAEYRALQLCCGAQN